ncbi:MAG: Spy/CpxP family protein refolding chaperone [Candidatus Omnitrophota bacterium]
MIKKLGVLTLVMVLAASFCVISGGYAAQGMKCSKCGKGSEHDMDLKDKFFKKIHFILKNEEELGLSDKQAKAIKKLKTDVKKDMINKKAQIDVLDVEIHTLMWEDPVDLDTMNSLIEQKYEIKKEKSKALAAACAQLKGILTEAQKDKMKSLWKKE